MLPKAPKQNARPPYVFVKKSETIRNFASKGQPSACITVCNCLRGWFKTAKYIWLLKLKEKKICAISRNCQNKRECWRCGTGTFTLDHLKLCKAAEAKCNYCGRKGHLESVQSEKKRKHSTIRQIKSQWHARSIQQTRPIGRSR